MHEWRRNTAIAVPNVAVHTRRVVAHRRGAPTTTTWCVTPPSTGEHGDEPHGEYSLQLKRSRIGLT
eukprot:9851802-Alexandrium_andersonii.AAC.1